KHHDEREADADGPTQLEILSLDGKAACWRLWGCGAPPTDAARGEHRPTGHGCESYGPYFKQEHAIDHAHKRASEESRECPADRPGRADPGKRARRRTGIVELVGQGPE